mmetsp:Transcript_11079/g.26140  ORF Transcript_11079/g.26140 Transcript_11079/m.26140 type:complete len:96 (+) Transcript_11079:2334-2621(+)
MFLEPFSPTERDEGAPCPSVEEESSIHFVPTRHFVGHRNARRSIDAISRSKRTKRDGEYGTVRYASWPQKIKEGASSLSFGSSETETNSLLVIGP